MKRLDTKQVSQEVEGLLGRVGSIEVNLGTGGALTLELETIKQYVSTLQVHMEEVQVLMAITQAEYQALQTKVDTNASNIGIHSTDISTINQTLTSINSAITAIQSRVSQIEINQLNLATGNLSIATIDEDSVVAGLQVSKSFALPLTTKEGGTITWASNNTTYITNTGGVTQPTYTVGNTDVLLTATVDYEGQKKTKDFIVTVLHAPATDQEKVDEDASLLSIDGFDEDSVSTGIQVTVDKLMQLTGDKHGTTISWATSDATHFSADGIVTRPAYNTANAVVTLTATLTSGTATASKQFSVTVLKAEATDAEKVYEDKTALSIAGFDEDSLSTGIQVSASKVMQLIGDVYSSNISWATSNATYFGADGTVVQPTYTVGDTTVTLTATITNGTASDTKTFTVTVLAAPATDQEKADEDASLLSIAHFDEDTATAGIQVTVSKTMQLTGDKWSSGISWATSNATYFAADGTVTRPDSLTGNVTVTLTATVTNGTATATKSMDVIVLATA